MAIKDLLKGTLRLAIAIFMALVGLSAVVAIYLQLKEFKELELARPFETVKEWQFDLKESLGVDGRVRTKLVSSRLLPSVDVAGHSQYFADSRNRDGTLNFEFLDKDGFKLATRSVKISEFTTVVGGNGKPTGLRYQYDEHFELDRYRQFSRVQVGWNLITERQHAAEAQQVKPTLDHCAPNLSKAERLKRLSQHGPLRQTGNGSFSAGGRSVMFFEYDGSLLDCR